MSIRWTQEDVAYTDWRPAWYVAQVQESNIENDWIKVQYTSEPRYIYKIDVTSEIAKGNMKIMSPVS